MSVIEYNACTFQTSGLSLHSKQFNGLLRTYYMINDQDNHFFFSVRRKSFAPPVLLRIPIWVTNRTHGYQSLTARSQKNRSLTGIRLTSWWTESTIACPFSLDWPEMKVLDYVYSTFTKKNIMIVWGWVSTITDKKLSSFNRWRTVFWRL